MRAAGTIAGLALATPFAMLVGPLPVLEALAIAIAAAFSFALISIEYALFTAAITAFIILTAHALGQGAEQAAGQRALATAIGLVIVALALAAWGGGKSRPSTDLGRRPRRGDMVPEPDR
jgi:uncharacterized membrane protein YccC